MTSFVTPLLLTVQLTAQLTAMFASGGVNGVKARHIATCGGLEL